MKYSLHKYWKCAYTFTKHCLASERVPGVECDFYTCTHKYTCEHSHGLACLQHHHQATVEISGKCYYKPHSTHIVGHDSRPCITIGFKCHILSCPLLSMWFSKLCTSLTVGFEFTAALQTRITPQSSC